jgi:hypothetical protein
MRAIHPYTPLNEVEKAVYQLLEEGDSNAWMQFTEVFWTAIRHRMRELLGSEGAIAFYRFEAATAHIYNITQDAIWFRKLRRKPMKLKPMTDHERAVIEKLKQGQDATWVQFLDAFGSPLYQRLHELTGGDEEKTQDYVSEIFVLVVQAMRKVKLDDVQ